MSCYIAGGLAIDSVRNIENSPVRGLRREKVTTPSPGKAASGGSYGAGGKDKLPDAISHVSGR